MYFQNLRFHDRSDDLYPLRFFYIYLCAFVFSCGARIAIKDHQELSKFCVRPLALSSCLIIGYGLLSYSLDFGYRRDGAAGINSFLPDLHAYAVSYSRQS